MSPSYRTVYMSVTVGNAERLKALLNELSHGDYWKSRYSTFMRSLLPAIVKVAKQETHYLTGHLIDAHDWQYDPSHVRGQVFISGSVVYATGNTLRWPRIYGPYEHARGGDHAFYERTMRRFQGNVYFEGEMVDVMVRDLRFRWH